MKALIPGFALTLAVLISCGNDQKINRYQLVTRHNIETSAIDSLNSLSVGNGEFAFTVDVTGLQTFPAFYRGGIPLGTMSNWGWHSSENPQNYSLEDNYREYEVNGRQVKYLWQYGSEDEERKKLASTWLRENPHRIHLGMIGLYILKKDGTEITIDDISDNVQRLNLWTGEIVSRFTVDGFPVQVTTLCHPELDQVSARIESGLIAENRLGIRVHFPLGIPQPAGYDFENPEGHVTAIRASSANVTLFERIQDADRYFVKLSHPGGSIENAAPHLYYIFPRNDSKVFEFSCLFSKRDEHGSPEDFAISAGKNRKSWEEFWSTGAAVDFSHCTDPRAPELERRVILSRYLTRIQCSGSLPPAETGLTYNSWFGKFHLEMHWWHAVHFALWQKEAILARQMNYYSDIIGEAGETARIQGYRGARWPKMTNPSGRESPSGVGVFLIWQQPHPIFYSELLYKNSSDKNTVLGKYSEIVFESAEFMASYAFHDRVNSRYVLGPVLIPAQESLKKESTLNPAFEIVYWYWGLKTAAEWKKRLGQEIPALWTDITERLSELAVQDGLYLCTEDTRDSWINPRYMSDHPIVSGIMGILPETGKVNSLILGNTLDTIMKKWNWPSGWGWDFPMLAMSAASIGRGEQALDFLMMDAPKNRYLLNGHNYQDPRLAVYLPGNGGLLTAVAKMCVCGQFPQNGRWKVRWENLNEYVD
jgi:hypothetical protein